MEHVEGQINKLILILYNHADMIFVNKFTQPQFLAQKIYAKKNRNRDKIKSATKQRKCPKMAILRHLGVEMDN